LTTIVGCGEPLQEKRQDDLNEIFLGGDISNILVGAARLLPVFASATGRKNDVQTKVLTCVGNDARGRALIKLYEDAGVQTDLIITLPRKTAAYELVSSTSGNEMKLNYKFLDREDSAARYLFVGSNDNIKRFLAKADRDTFLVTTGIAISRPLNKSAFDSFLCTLDAVKAQGTTIVFNTELRVPLFDNEVSARHRIEAVWRRADVVLCSYPDDLTIFHSAKRSREDARDYIFRQGTPSLIISEGAHGLRLYRGNGRNLFVPALKIIDPRGIVDTAGGSAALTASTVAALAIGLSLEDAARISVLLARNVMSILGGVPPPGSIPTVEEVRKALNGS
jgi:sugar/nucleoside kinase (ribokinase family)